MKHLTYTYDANGNLKSDAAKGITNIIYNYLNLPQVITFTNGRSIEFVYDATGAKLRKTVIAPNVAPIVTDYMNGFEYKNNVLEKIYHTEGYLERKTDGTFQYNYVLKDHLGNTRVTFADKDNNGTIDPNTEINQINHYAPFGLNLDGNWNGASADAKNKIQYNGKELQTDFDLNWNDYGARMYDPAIGRWNAVDPLAESYKRWSPYNYTKDNPIKYIDPDGMKVINGDEAAKNKAEANKTKHQDSFISHYGNNRNKTKDQFFSKGEYSTYKSERKDLKKAERAFNRANETYKATENRINDMKENTPATFEHLDNLTYKDGTGTVRDLDVIMKTTSSLPDDTNGKIQNGATAVIADKLTGRLYSADHRIDAVSVYITPNAPANAASHEIGGHVWDLIADGKGNMRNWNGSDGILDIYQQMKNKPDCRTNESHPRVGPAIDAERHFDKMHNIH